MSNTSYNFKDNLTIDNNKYLKWLDSTGTSRSNIIALNNSNDVLLNSATGSVFLNSNNSGSSTFINVSNNANVIVASKLGVGFNSANDVSANVTIAKNGYIGVNTTTGTNDGYLGLSGSHTLTNTSGSRILLYGIDNTVGNSGKVMIYGGNNTEGSVDIFTGNDSRKLQINNNGSTLFTPDGSTVRCSINDSTTTFTNTVILTNTTTSTSASTGALQIAGGLGVVGNCFVDGTLSINSMTGNINFDSSQTSSSYTTGAIYISGGLGISNTVDAASVTSGGGLSVAGGVAIGKSLFVGGNVTILNSTAPTSAQTGSVVLYGGLGINNSIWSRTNNAPQVRLAPVSDGAQTSVAFFSKSDFDTLATGGSSTWFVGQNVGSIGSGNFGIHSVQTGTILTAGFNGFIGIGTTAPTTTLDIRLGSHNLRFFNDGVPAISCTTALRMRPVGLELFGNSVNPPYFDIRSTSGSIVTRFNANGDPNYVTIGRFGLGTSTPGTTLHVVGDGLFTSTVDAVNTASGGCLTINGGVAIGKSAFIGGPILQIPRGDSASRPTPVTRGSVRYNTETDQFEGFGAADTWGTLGGVVDVNQDTKILAENGAGTNDDNLRFFTAGAERMRINSSGNIGVGTSSPSATLDINGSATISNGITTSTIIASSVSTGSLLTSNVNTNTGTFGTINALGITVGTLLAGAYASPMIASYNTATSGQLVFTRFDGNTVNSLIGYNSQSTLVISNQSGIDIAGIALQVNAAAGKHVWVTGGNFGIGTTAPAFSLDVVGTARVSTGITTGELSVVNVSTATLNVSGQMTTANLFATNLFATNITASGALVSNNTLGNILTSNITVGNLFNTNQTTSRLRITGISINNTVNTYSLTSGALNIGGDTVIDGNELMFTTTGVNPPTLGTRSPGTKLVLYPQINNTEGDFSIGIQHGSIWFQVPAIQHGYFFYHGTSANFSIASAGNIGIGTTAPTAKLDVVGNLEVTGTTNTIGNIFTTGGNVGIGVLSPLSRLHLASNNTANNILIEAGALSDGGNIGFSAFNFNGYNNGTEQRINTNKNRWRMACDQRGASDHLSLDTWNGTTNTTLIGLSTAGDVGIRTLFPTIALDVTGTLGMKTSVASWDHLYLTHDGGSALIRAGGAEAGMGLDVGNGASGSYGGQTYNRVMTLTSTGNVGIGTTNPTTTLDVIGNIRSTQLTVSSSSNATGVGTGGSLTVLGGASFGRDVYVGGTLTSSSDIRLKENVRTLRSELGSRVLDTIDNIRTIKFSYINDPDSTQNIGFIAQDFEDNYPELLRKPHNGFYTLDYQKITVLLMESVKELKHEIDDLKSKLRRAVTKFP